MIFNVGGCYGSESAGYHSVGFLINGKLLLEGGTVTSAFSVEQQKAIDNIIISHIHLDHTKELFFLLDNLAPLNSTTVTISGVGEVIGGIKKYLFNEQLWPDFSRLPSIGNPVLKFREVEEGTFSKIGDMEIMPVRVDHPVPATGYVIREAGSTIVYTGDTGPTSRIWKSSCKEKDLRAIVVETSFPNSMVDLAITSGHLTPGLLEKELDKAGRPEVPVYIFHMKPLYLEQIEREIREITRYRIEILQQGKTYIF